MDKIFVQIASYRDPELVPTIENCLQNADKPQALVFSIAWQHSKYDTWDNLDKFINNPQFKIIDIDYMESKGCCWARNMLQQQYTDEKYTLQLDSHHRFIKGWDTELIKMYNDLISQGFSKPLITAYLPQYSIKNDPEGRVMLPYQMNFDRFIPEGAIFFLPAVIPNYDKLTSPIRARFYSAHFAFTTGLFVKEVPHDPLYYFHGEEISIGVRAFTHGYDLFHPHKVIAWHEYTRVQRVSVWSDDSNWHIKNTESHLRNRKLFMMDGLKRDYDFGIYDFGKIRSLKDYEKFAGISFSKRAVQKYTLDNNYAPNPQLSEEDFEQSFLNIFKHCIDVHKSQLPLKDYSFLAVIFDDEYGQIYREDMYEKEIQEALSKGTDFINIWRMFNADRRPKYWTVWPYSKSLGWQDKIVGHL